MKWHYDISRSQLTVECELDDAINIVHMLQEVKAAEPEDEEDTWVQIREGDYEAL